MLERGRFLMKKATMTLNLSKKEMEAIEKLADKKGMNKTSLVKQALRLYQTVEVRLAKGEKIYLEDNKKQKSELIFI